MYTAILITIFCFANGVLMNALPPACTRDNTECLKDLANNIKSIIFAAKPEFGTESSDPMYIEQIDDFIPSLNTKFTKNTITGYLGCKISNLKNLKLDDEVTHLELDMNCPKLEAVGKYEGSGELLGLQVNGNGDYKMTTGEYFIHFNGTLKKSKGDDGKTYMSITDFKLFTEPRAPVTFKFDNLFNGQKDLSDTFHKLVNENWKEVSIGQDPLWTASVQRLVDNANSVFKNLSLDNFIINH